MIDIDILSKRRGGVYNECMRHTLQDQSGQVLLMTLLVLAVATTIGLALIGRASTDVSISNRIEESARAFSAAEAGIEEALKTGASVANNQLTNAKYSVNVVTSGGPNVYPFPAKTPRGTAATLWFAPHASDGSLDKTQAFGGAGIDVCWSSEPLAPAILVSVLYDSSGTYKIARAAFDPAGRGNNFTSVAAAGAGCGQGNVFKASITFSALGILAGDKLLALRLQPVYADTQFYVDPRGVPLPLQGTRIESTGQTDTGITRKIVAFQEFRSPSAIFDAVIYSQGSFGQ